jgi:pyruvate dehydrogenase E2 component (dihydrolipoamide acetyltransferase)
VAKVKETRKVAEAIAYVTAPGEQVPVEAGIEEAGAAAEVIQPRPGAVEEAPRGDHQPASPAARRLAKELGVDLSQVKGSGPDGKIKEEDVNQFAKRQVSPVEILASPMAKSLAREHGLDLAQIKGSGPGGRITESDVENVIESRQRAPEAPALAAAPPAGARVIPFTGTRLMIAQRLSESLQTMAQVTASTEVDVTEMVKMRAQVKKKFDLTYTDILIKAVTLALKEHPLLNSTQVGDEIHLLEEYHIGVAVALEDGLIVPVVRNADKLTLQEIAKETRRLAEAARAGELNVDEVTGSTFTITNLGMYGIDTSTPIVNPPEVAILGVGRIIEKPAVFQGEITRRSLMGLSLTFDHRIVDGAPAASFLVTLTGLLESPYLLFV